MNRAASRRAGRPALELIEAAVHLLRTAPAGALLSYYVGSVPCMLGLLYFWADMSRGAFARERLIEASLSAAALYLWMKCWHTVFASKLRAHLLLEREAPWTVGARRAPRADADRRAAVRAFRPPHRRANPHSLRLDLRAFTKTSACSATALAPALREVVREAAQAGAGCGRGRRMARCSVLFGFALFVWLNVCVAGRPRADAAQDVLRHRDGVLARPVGDVQHDHLRRHARRDLPVLRSDPQSPLRPALLSTALRSRSGEDLRVELKALRAARGTVVARAASSVRQPWRRRWRRPRCRAASAARRIGGTQRVGRSRAPAARIRVAPAARRRPREADEKKGWLTTFFEELWKKLVRTVKKIVKWIGKAYEWLRKIFEREAEGRRLQRAAAASTGPATARWTLIVLDRGAGRASSACCSGAGARAAAAEVAVAAARSPPCRT